MNVVVFGAQWGDEGKGKVSSYLVRSFDVAVRFQGGNNAGHTVIRNGEKHKFSVLPCGILEPDVKCVIGSGVVLDLSTLVKEIDTLERQGFSASNLVIADNLSLILPIHRELDAASEANRRIGTTGRGIGFCYEDRVGRRAVRLSDVIIGGPHLRSVVSGAVENHHGSSSDQLICVDELERHVGRVEQYIVSSMDIFKLCTDQRKRVLYEGSQGFWLDIYHGTYPYVTSSSIIPAQACSGTPTALGSLGTCIGVAKAYVTRVGSGPMPTEQQNEIGELLATKGVEFGTVTRRKRRCGWFDAVMVRQALLFSSAEALILTKLDVLDGMKSINICVGYRLRGEIIDHYPSSPADIEMMEPIYEEMPGWQEKTHGIADDLPANALAYIRRIEKLVGVPVIMVSTTPNSEDMIVVDKSFAL